MTTFAEYDEALSKLNQVESSLEEEIDSFFKDKESSNLIHFFYGDCASIKLKFKNYKKPEEVIKYWTEKDHDDFCKSFGTTLSEIKTVPVHGGEYWVILTYANEGVAIDWERECKKPYFSAVIK